jgi:starvation-inducible DNA-binding protein
MRAAPVEPAEALDGTLADLIGLGLQAKHSAWNLVGPSSAELRATLDGLAEFARAASDEVAERARILGHHPRGTIEAVAGATSLGTLARGGLPVTDAIALSTEVINGTAGRVHAAIDTFVEDPVTRDLFTRIAGALERQGWLIRTQRP